MLKKILIQLKTIEILQKCGAEWTGRTQNISQSIQPRYQANVYTKENIITTFLNTQSV